MIVGRFIIEARQLTPGVLNLEELLKKEHFLNTVKAAKMCAIKSSGKEKEVATVPLRIGYGLKDAVGCIVARAIGQSDDVLKNNAKEWLELYELQWCKRVSFRSLQLLRDRRMNKPIQLPSRSDMTKFSDGLNTLVEERMQALLKTPSSGNWKRLADASLAKTIHYNAKRGSDVSQMKMLDYIRAMETEIEQGDEIFISLNAAERQAALSHHLVMVKGKKNRPNCVIFTDTLKAAVDLLIEKRLVCEIPPSNQYVFALPGSQTFINHSPVMRQMRNLFQVKNMETRKVRKYVATNLLATNPSEATTDMVARHLGHDIMVHREYYRYCMQYFCILNFLFYKTKKFCVNKKILILFFIFKRASACI